MGTMDRPNLVVNRRPFCPDCTEECVLVGIDGNPATLDRDHAWECPICGWTKFKRVTKTRQE